MQHNTIAIGNVYTHMNVCAQNTQTQEGRVIAWAFSYILYVAHSLFCDRYKPVSIFNDNLFSHTPKINPLSN